MENDSYSTKRKKRRTRRYLNEIRNRRKCENSLPYTKLSMLQSKKPENRLITMDRLTLNTMFPNVVKSETITRPVLEEIKRKQNANFAENSAVNKIAHSNVEFLSNNVKASEGLDKTRYFNEYGDFSICTENKNNIIKSSNSSGLFSPTGFVSKAITPNKSDDEDSVTSVTSQTSLDIKDLRYKELMNEIPSFIAHFASPLNKEENTVKKIHKLRKMYMESCKKECEVVRPNSENVPTLCKRLCIEKKLIVENPLDYIRLKHEHQPNIGSSVDSISCSLSSSIEPTYSPASSCASTDLHFKIVPYDTPDYNYYPHPLK